MLRAGTIEEQQLIVRADSRRAPVVTVVNISRMLWVQGDEVTSVYRISLKSLALRSLELHDDIASLVVMIAGIVDELAPELICSPFFIQNAVSNVRRSLIAELQRRSSH